MALSNWDTLAVNEKGEWNGAVFTSPLGVTVEFYKNWLYVRDEKAWEKGGAFMSPVVMSVNSGDLSYKDVKIHAIRGPKQGIYAVVYSQQYEPHKEGQPYKKPILTAMVGCGVYGYDNDTGEWLGVQEAELKFLKDYVNGSETEELVYYSTNEKGERTKGTYPPSTFYDFDEEIRKIPLDNAVRFNQGDAFFAVKAGVDLQATKPGEPKEPHMTKIIEAMKKE